MSKPSRLSHAIVVSIGYLLLLLTLLSWLCARVLDVTRQPIFIRWRVQVTEAERQHTETALGLTGSRSTPDQATYEYRLTDTSASVIRRIVDNPLVADTGNIDRVNHRVRLSRSGWPQSLVGLGEQRLLYPCALLSTCLTLALFWQRRQYVLSHCRSRAFLSIRLSLALVATLLVALHKTLDSRIVQSSHDLECHHRRQDQRPRWQIGSWWLLRYDEQGFHLHPRGQSLVGLRPLMGLTSFAPTPRLSLRSEEHTSELQSH